MAEHTVLIVEDDADTREMYAMWFRSLNLRTEEADSGADGWERAQATRPSLILLDVKLRDLNGADLCQRLKSDSATRDIPIVIVSGMVGEGSRGRLASAGADVILPKPVSLDQLGSVCRTLMDRSR